MFSLVLFSCSLILFHLISSPPFIFLFSIILFLHFSSSFPPLISIAPLSFLLFFPIFLFPVFCLHFFSSSFHPPRFYFLIPFSLFLQSLFFLFIPIFLFCSPLYASSFLSVIIVATFLEFFTALVTLTAVCGRQDPGNVATLVLLFHALYMIRLPGNKAYEIGQILAGPEAVVGHA